MLGKQQLLAVLVGACLMLALPSPCPAATTITVNSNSDTGSMAICVLRDAITAANTNTTTNGCTVGAGGGPFTIVFDSSLFGDTVTLGSTLPAITSTNLTITGPSVSSSAIIIDGNQSVQIMQINLGATVSLQYLTFENGFLQGASGSASDEQGGAIQNNGTLTIANCTLSNNQAIGGSSGGTSQGVHSASRN